MKKLLQRVFGIAASAALLLTSAIPAFADGHQHHKDDTLITNDGLGDEIARYDITLTVPAGYKIASPEFGAYQIFTGTVKNGGTSYINPGDYVGDETNSAKSMIPLTDIKWGSAFGKQNDKTKPATLKGESNTETWEQIWQNNIVGFVYALANPPTDDEYASAFKNFHGFDGNKADNNKTGLTYDSFSGNTENTLADRFYYDTGDSGIDENDRKNDNVNFNKLATEVADVINKHNDREWLQAFTDILGGYGTGYAEGNFVCQYYGSKKSDENYVIKDVPEGYYMVLDRSAIQEDGSTPDKSYSARMLFVANNITQQIKEDVPSLEKNVVRDDNKLYETEAERPL